MPTEITPEQREALAISILKRRHPRVRPGGSSWWEKMRTVEQEVDDLLAAGWRAPGPATEEEVERAAREICMKERGRDPDKRVILLRSEPDKTVKIDKGPQWQQHVNAARAALNAALNHKAGNG